MADNAHKRPRRWSLLCLLVGHRWIDGADGKSKDLVLWSSCLRCGEPAPELLDLTIPYNRE